MKTYGAMRAVRLSQVRPEGWLKTMLEKAREGFPGHLDEIGYPFNLPCWTLKSMADGGFEQWWPYEQTGYWMDAMTRTALLLRDDDMLSRFKAIIDTSIERAQDGFIGPNELHKADPRSQWPHAVYFRAIYAMWSMTGDEKYLSALERHYMLPDNRYDQDRGAVNIETMLRTALAAGNEALRQKALDNYARLQADVADTADFGYRKMLSDAPTGIHGVSLNEIGKLPAIIYAFTGDEEQLRAAEHLYAKILRDHMLPDGVHSSSEKTCGNGSLNCHESCDISDFTWSVGYLLAATGDGKYADLIERAIFNAAPGAIAPDFKAIQYFSGVNQVRAARNSCHVDAFQNTPRMAYQPHHYPECCVGNIGRAFPNYAARMYWEDGEGVVCALYGDSEYTGCGLTLRQSGGYPFGETIFFSVSCAAPVETTIRFRIPGWCRGASLTLNGRDVPLNVQKGFAALHVVFHDGDGIALRLPMAFKAHTSAEGGVYFDYGPLLLALRIREKWTIDRQEPRQTAAFPAWNVDPESEWRYAVTGGEQPEIVRRAPAGLPWWGSCPLEISIPARRLTNWETVKKISLSKHADEGIDARQIALGATEITDDLEQTPPLPDKAAIAAGLGAEERIVLVPYGCTHLRISVFPKYEESSVPSNRK